MNSETKENQKVKGKIMKTEVIRNQAGVATAKKTMKKLILKLCVSSVSSVVKPKPLK